jgi:hypothetical protein
MVLLWVSLLGTGFRIGAEAEDSLREDLVRTLALLKEGEPPLSPEALLESTGFYLLRQEAGSVIEANIPERPIREGLMALPLPPPTFPSLGPLQGVDQEGVYAHLRVGSQGSIILLAPAIRVPQRRFMLLMGGLGGIASLLCLGYLLPFRRGTGR